MLDRVCVRKLFRMAHCQAGLFDGAGEPHHVALKTILDQRREHGPPSQKHRNDPLATAYRAWLSNA